MVVSWPVLLQRTTSGSIALQQQESLTTNTQADVPGLGCHLGPCRAAHAAHQLQHSKEQHLLGKHSRAGPDCSGAAGELVLALADLVVA